MQALLSLKGRLARAVESAISEEAGDFSPEFAEVLCRAARHSAQWDECSLLACGTASWCGADPEAGMPAAVASQLMRSALLCHATLPGFTGLAHAQRQSAVWEEIGEASAILAGDALIPLALRILASSGSVHALALVQDAVRTLGAGGILAGYSLELDPRGAARAGGGTGAGDGERPLDIDQGAVRRLYSGQLARFAAASGARQAGADRELVGEASLLGLRIGRAAELIAGCQPGRAGSQARQDAVGEASALLDEALGITGNGPEGDLLRRLVESVWTKRTAVQDDGSGDLFEN